MIRTASRFLLAMAVLGTVACEEEVTSLDSGDPSTIEVRAYVDTDGDGAFDASTDRPIDGATVTATGALPGDETVLTAPTDDLGRAVLENVDPGSYRLTFSGDVPPGAVLATATSPLVVAPFAGATIAREFRYSYLPGELSGRLFRNDDQSGGYDPDTDLAAAGISIALYRGGTAEGDPVATTTTGPEGLYSFTGVRPGGYTVVVDALPTMDVLGGATRVIDIGADQAVDLDFVFEGTLVLPVAEAREAPLGQTVTVEGVVTYQAQWDDRVYYVQDETGGIGAFDGSRPALEIGDRVRLTGTRGAFRGEIQISPVANVEVLGQAPVPDPVSVTAEQITAGEFQGRLAVADGRVETVEVVNQFGSHVVTLQDAGGEAFTVFVDNRTGVSADVWEVGTAYTVTGLLASSGEDEYQLEVRFPEDVVQGSAAISIEEARQRPGEEVTIEGTVTWQAQWDERVYFLQDGTGGISTFHSGAPELQRGDRVRLKGTIGAFRGETQIGDVTGFQVLSSGAAPTPRGVAAEQINDGLFQGQLVTLTATVDAVDVGSFDNQTVTLTGQDGNTFTAYVDSRTGLGSAAWPAPGETVRVTGVLGSDDRNDPAARLELRGPEDLEVVPAGSTSIAEARQMAGLDVTVEGVVSRQTPWNTRVYYFQDASGGISTFHSDAPDDLQPGDRVTLTGTIGAFGGETQISSVTAFEVERGGTAPAPVDATAAQINAGFFQGMLARLTGEVLAIEIINQFGTQQVTVRDASGETATVLVDNRSGLTEEDWTVGETVTIVAPVGFFDGNDPGPQLEVVAADDVTFGS